LERVRHLNEKCIAAAASRVVEEEARSTKVLSVYRDLWRRMDQIGCKRAARCPVLLLDLHFENPVWWHWIVHQGPRPVKTPPDTEPLLPIAESAPLLREILVEACVIALSHPRAARLVFGMAPAVVEAMTGLRASEIDSIVLTHAAELRLRCADNLVFWKNLLNAATDGTEEEMAEVRLHCLQLLGNSN
jgi:hypothetical protein